MPVKKPAGHLPDFYSGRVRGDGRPGTVLRGVPLPGSVAAAAFPQTHFEIVNLGITAINSHVILPIARDCAKADGDLWIIYMGNNEMVGPFGAATVFGAKLRRCR